MSNSESSDSTGQLGERPLMAIGTFARATLLSVRALRSYHQQGVLVPASVDPGTGYRAYHPSQLSDAGILRRLRQLDLPLSAVKEVLEARDPDVTGKILADHAEVMRLRLAETEQIVAELQQAVDHPLDATPVHTRSVPHQHALALRGSVPSSDFAVFLDTAFNQLGACVAQGGFVVCGPTGALYDAAVHDHESEPVTAYFPITAPAPLPHGFGNLEVIEIPAATVAVAVHAGPYETMGDTYTALGLWVAYNGEPSGLDVREQYLVSPSESDDPAMFRTEVHWPIKA